MLSTFPSCNQNGVRDHRQVWAKEVLRSLGNEFGRARALWKACLSLCCSLLSATKRLLERCPARKASLWRRAKERQTCHIFSCMMMIGIIPTSFKTASRFSEMVITCSSLSTETMLWNIRSPSTSRGSGGRTRITTFGQKAKQQCTRNIRSNEPKKGRDLSLKAAITVEGCQNFSRAKFALTKYN